VPFVSFRQRGLEAQGVQPVASLVRIPWTPELVNRVRLLKLRLRIDGAHPGEALPTGSRSSSGGPSPGRALGSGIAGGARRRADRWSGGRYALGLTQVSDQARQALDD
jgi:hypothetical protein